MSDRGENTPSSALRGRCVLCGDPAPVGLVSFCPACDALPEATDADKERQRLADERRRREERAAKWVKLIDRAYRDTDRAKLPERAAELWPRMPRWDFATGRGLTLIGATGAGKTRLAVRAMEAAHARGASCLFFRAGTMRMRLWESFKAVGQVMREAQAPDVLLFDDLGQGATTEQIDEVTLAILEARTAAMKPTIVTTQFRDARLVARFARPETGEAIARRVGKQMATVLDLQPKTT